MMQKHEQAVMGEFMSPDVEMINDARKAVADLGIKWKEQGKLGPKSMASLLVATCFTYLEVGLRPEALPMLVSTAWGVANALKEHADKAAHKAQTEQQPKGSSDDKEGDQ